MRKLFVMAMLASSVLTANAETQDAETFSIMPRVGFGYSHLSNMDKCSDGTGCSLGLEGQYMFNDCLGASIGADFGFMQSGKDSYSTVGDLYINSFTLNIPVMAQFHIGEHLALKAGVMPSFLIDPRLRGTARMGFITGDRQMQDIAADFKIKDYTNNFQFCIPVGISYELSQPIVLDLRANIPLTKILDKDKDPFGEGSMVSEDVRMFNVMLTVGYRFDFE